MPQYLPTRNQNPPEDALIDPESRARLEAIEREVRALADYLDGVSDAELAASAALRYVERRIARVLGLPSRLPPPEVRVA